MKKLVYLDLIVLYFFVARRELGRGPPLDPGERKDQGARVWKELRQEVEVAVAAGQGAGVQEDRTSPHRQQQDRRE